MSENNDCLGEKKVLEIIDELKMREGKFSRKAADFIDKNTSEGKIFVYMSLSSVIGGSLGYLEGGPDIALLGAVGGLFASAAVMLSACALAEPTLDSDKKLEEKIPWSVRIYPKIVLNRTGDWNHYKEAVALENEIYTWARNIDLYSEDGKDWNKSLAETAMKNLIEKSKEKFGEPFAGNLHNMSLELAKFFPYENELWKSVKSDIPPTDEEITKYVDMRGSDALLHGEIVRGFTNEDWSQPMWACMKLKDISNDLEQYKKDFEAGLPNVYYMFGAQERRVSHLRHNNISEYANNKVEGLKEDILNSIITFDYQNCDFLKREIAAVYESGYTGLGC